MTVCIQQNKGSHNLKDDNNEVSCVFALLQSALCDHVPAFSFENVDWTVVSAMAIQHGVAALCLDGVQKVENKSNGGEALSSIVHTQCKFEWIGAVIQQERQYANQYSVLQRLCDIVNKHGLKMLLLKGYGCSLYYPISNHRSCGDIDIYLYGNGGEIDNLIEKEYGVVSKQNEDKHSVFYLDDIMVENHAVIINTAVHPQLNDLEEYFEKESCNALEIKLGEGSCYIPSVNMNALFLAYHTASHFCRDETSLRQLCDWATFVLREGRNVDWKFVEEKAKESGFFEFFCCLNGIVHDYLGVPSDLLPQLNANRQLEHKVLMSIIYPKYVGKLSAIRKLKRFFDNQWKNRMVYNENILQHFYLLAKSYYRTKVDKNDISIWAKN